MNNGERGNKGRQRLQRRIRGKRMTGPRRVIIEYLSNQVDFRSVDEIYHAVHEIFPGIGMTTVYRTLALLDDLGVVCKLDSGDGKSRYRLLDETESARHYHVLVCRSCSRLIRYSEFSPEEEEMYLKTERAIDKAMDFKVEKHLVQYHGLCSQCRNAGG
jgi:Fur family ferric uptake transcriptional regulator